MIVVAAHAGLAVDHLDGRRAAELAAAKDQRLLEEPALLEVGQEGRDGLVAVLGSAVVLRDVVVAVPGLDVAMVELDEPHAPLDQTSGDQELPGLDARPIGVTHILRLLARCRRRRWRPSASGRPARSWRSAPPGRRPRPGARWCIRFRSVKQVELPALVGPGHGRVAGYSRSGPRPGCAGCRCMSPGTRRAGRRIPVGDVGDRQTGTHRDETGQVLVLGAQAVGESRHPCWAATAARRRSSSAASMLVVGRVGHHRADHAEVVDVLGRPGEDLADLDPALAVLLEPKRRRRARPRLALRGQVPLGQRLALVLLQERLGVEGVDLRRPTVQIDVDDMLGLGGEVRRLRRQRIADRRTAPRPGPRRRPAAAVPR